jgi:hypothetical protein
VLRNGMWAVVGLPEREAPKLQDLSHDEIGELGQGVRPVIAASTRCAGASNTPSTLGVTETATRSSSPLAARALLP